jgi:hypothetical protein
MGEDYNLIKIYEQVLTKTNPGHYSDYKTLQQTYERVLMIEKVLNWGDFTDALRKYSRLTIIDNKIKAQEPFELQNGQKEVLSYNNNSYGDLFKNQKVDELRQIGGSRINRFPFFKTKKGQLVSFNDIIKSAEFGGKGAKSQTSERQERGLIEFINSIPGVKTIVSRDGSKIENVIAAEKVEKLKGKPEPYSDIKLILPNQEFFVSAKGSSAPTLGSGGILGIKELTKNNNNPEILNFVSNFYKKAYEYYKKNIEIHNLQGQNLYKNKLIPDVSIKVPQEIVKQLLQGTKEMGGPISYYYIGDMNVQLKEQENKNTIEIANGSFVPIDKFIEEKANKLYAHIRKRDGDLYFTDAVSDLNGKHIPAIFTKRKNGQGGAQSRFGMIDKIRGHLID